MTIQSTTRYGLTVVGVKDLLNTLLEEGNIMYNNVNQLIPVIEKYNKQYADVISSLKSPNLPSATLLKLKILDRNIKSVNSTHNDLLVSITNSNNQVTNLLEHSNLFMQQQRPANTTRRQSNTKSRPNLGIAIGGYKKVYSIKRSNKKNKTRKYK